MDFTDQAHDLHVRADHAALGDAVRARRRELHLTQQELADLADVSVRFVHALEHGKPTVQLAQLLAVLGVLGRSLALVAGAGSVEVTPATEDDAPAADDR